MNLPRQLRSAAVAVMISLALNGVLLVIDFSIHPQQDKLSTIENIVVGLLRPADLLTRWLAPGHGGAQILFLIMSSVVFYAVVAWVALSLPIWWRHRG